ncbi:hypothetical protein K466DRAFT_504692 [Polyporus arcularius HHB13444]|uniref:CxC2-like cysteine cluster KDZ transposase-associated domain-containing protein n=1 Tax=Polyporus arcularius HHB13444 TaxID=1314778 RepID=A0A5C3NVD3_9APHY|nr:hypothetical protein K466DRAFT_504692 [Polyporus arcularius HHB13444]
MHTQEKIREWTPLREEFLEELLRFYGGEAPVDTEKVPCAACGVEPESGLYRCSACTSRRLLCKTCVLSKHADLPLHRLERWTGRLWEKTSLRDAGLVFQLGHDGSVCDHPSEKTRRIVVGDVTGIHEVQVLFCECLDGEENFTFEWVQLFRQGWFPATTDRPATAFTFRMLSAFQELNFQGKTNLYDYWKSLERITENTGTAKSLNRYRQISHVMRLWRHLTALKRAGRAHDPSGAAGTQEGELALDCPACPHPDKNLPKGWESAPPEVKWLYTLFIMVDANFRAKLKDRGLEDAELGPGWAHYVENSKFKAHVDSLGKQTDTSTCSAEHKAIQNANLRRDGYIASGVGAVLCARHAMVRKSAVGDLPNGEKFSIMDYLVFSTILGMMLMILISYDIACQWHKKLARRAREDLPPHIRTDISGLSLRYAIPKKHIRVHGPNHSRFSFNFLRWVGRTYAEGIEAHWAHMNPVSLSAREMGPGQRREHMDDHWGAWNWQKIIGFAVYLLRLLREADKMYAKQRAAHESLTATFEPEVVKKWEAEIEAWNEDPTKATDPYEEVRASATLKSTRLQIADEEAQELAAGTLPPHDVSPGVFLQHGLEIEEQQRAIRAHERNSSATDGNLADLQEKRNGLTRRIDTWRGMQDLHMPVVAHTADSETPPPPRPTSSSHLNSANIPSPGASNSPSPGLTKAENIRLWLPSALPPVLRASLPSGLADKERRLRIAQADDALEDLRRLRRIITGIADFSRLNITGTGQRTGGKVRTLFSKFQAKVRRAAERYRAARAALVSLDSGGEWEGRFRELHDSDIRGPGRESDVPSEGRYEISWIWLVPRGSSMTLPDGVDGQLDPSEFLENVKVEWARSKARAERWGEEVLLLKEEMRRVIEYFEWKASWWRAQPARRSDAPSALRRGLSSYAEYQASVFESIANHCARRWVPYLRTRAETMPTWAARYDIPDTKQRTQKETVGVAQPSDTRAGTSVSTALPEELRADSSGSDSDSADSESDSDL